MPHALLAILIACLPSAVPAPGLAKPDDDTPASAQQPQDAPRFQSPRQLLDALGEQDAKTTSLSGTIRYTVINALENDRQMRVGELWIADAPAGPDASAAPARRYAVSFKKLIIDQRQEQIAEHYIFDGRWLVERLPEDKQFNKYELVPKGESLDPMALMRDAPFWISLGGDQDRLLASYDAKLPPADAGLVDNPDFPELKHLATQPYLKNASQLILSPKPGSDFEDDWEWVRIWINNDTLLPVLYIKSEWTGDLQIVELFETKANTDLSPKIFDTATPPEDSGWRVQISHWRGDADRAQNQRPQN